MSNISLFSITISCFVIFGAILGYLSGSVMWAIIISKFLKKDVRNFESKNPGATNTARVLGKKWGILVLLLDALKAALPIIILFLIGHFWIFNQTWWIECAYNNQANASKLYWNPDVLIYIPGFFAIIGHLYPVFFKFKGGKGISSFGGCLFMISPFIGLIWILTIILCIVITKYVSIGSITSVIIGPLFLLIPGVNYFYLIYPNIIESVAVATSQYMTQYLLPIFCLLILGFLLTWKHRTNIIAVKHKKERQFSFRKSTWVGENQSYEQ